MHGTARHGTVRYGIVRYVFVCVSFHPSSQPNPRTEWAHVTLCYFVLLSRGVGRCDARRGGPERAGARSSGIAVAWLLRVLLLISLPYRTYRAKCQAICCVQPAPDKTTHQTQHNTQHNTTPDKTTQQYNWFVGMHVHARYHVRSCLSNQFESAPQNKCCCCSIIH